MECEEVVKNDPRWQEGMRKRGVEDFDLAMIDPWASSYTGPGRPSLQAAHLPSADVGALRARRARLRAAGREPRRHGRPRHDGGRRRRRLRRRAAAAEAPGNYEEPWIFEDGNVPSFTQYRDDVKPIEITQPEGPSFTVDGHHVQWQKWDLRIGFTPREGLVLHQIGYDDRGTLRPIIHRAGLAEMYVPYGDPAPTHRIKNVFDQGEYGIGWLANPLTLGLRLRRAHPVLRRHRQRPGRQPRHDRERDLHARGGRGHRVEAHRLPHGEGGGAPAAPPRHLDDRHRRQLRVRVLLVPLQRRHDRVRGQADRRALRRRLQRRRDARVRHDHQRPACTRRTISTSSACGWTWRSTAR